MGPATLIEKGWGCFADESHGVWAHCWPRGTDFFSFPPSMLNLNYATFDLEEDADFLGTEVLIREDIFNGQPCPQGTTADGEYELVPDIGGPGTPDYYSCHHFDEVPEF